jgi:hypothetical protein
VTAAANRCHQRPLTAHNTRAIHANWGYVRPEKRAVEDRRQDAVTVANTVAKPLDERVACGQLRNAGPAQRPQWTILDDAHNPTDKRVVPDEADGRGLLRSLADSPYVDQPAVRHVGPMAGEI